MIVSQLQYPAVSDQVDPAVTCVSHKCLIILQDQNGAGRPHPLALAISAGAVQDDAIGFPDSEFESLVDG